MSKLDELKRIGRATARESIGVRGGAAGVSHGDSPSAAPGPPPIPERLQGVSKAQGVLTIPLAKIAADPAQPRKDFDPESLERLAANLRSRGQLQPIRVRWDGRRSKYLIVAGERRYRAADLAGLESLVCVVDDRAAAAEEVLLDQLAENCARADLSPLDLAASLQALAVGHGLSTRRIADETGMSQSAVARSLALAELPAALQAHVVAGFLAPSVALEIGRLDDASQIESLAVQAINFKWSRDRVAERVRWLNDEPRRRAVDAAEVSHGDSPGTEPIVTSAASREVSDPVEVSHGDSPGTELKRTERDPAGWREIPLTEVLPSGLAETLCLDFEIETLGDMDFIFSDADSLEDLELGPTEIAVIRDSVLEFQRGWRPDLGIPREWLGTPADSGVSHGDSPKPEPGRTEDVRPSPAVSHGDSPPPRPAYVIEEFTFVVKSATVMVEGAPGGPACIKALEGALYQARRKYGPGAKFPPGTRVEVADPESGDQGRRGVVEGVSPHNHEILHVWLDLPGGCGGRQFANFDPDQLTRVDQ